MEEFHMKPKLILIEGLPGSGKTTTAGLVHELLTEMNLSAKLFLEGDVEHPADYEGVACFNRTELAELWSTHAKYRDLLSERLIQQGDNYFLEYRKIIQELGANFPDELLGAICRNDIYELPLDRNRELITGRWKAFAESAYKGSDTYVFDCCFIQNPVTVGMVKYGANMEYVKSYVTGLAEIAGPLKPLLIYVAQNDLGFSFRKAVGERPKEWSEGFIDYYTNQGYGARQGYHGLEGALQVLKARSELEAEIFNSLAIAKHKVDNSAYDLNGYKQVLAKIIGEHFNSALRIQ
jgi:hypothetical protein